MLVADIYNTNISPVKETQTVQEVLKFLIEKHFNGVVVLNDEDKVAGVLSLQDIAAAIVPDEMRENLALAEAMYKPGFFREQCQAIKDMQVKEIMRKNVVMATPETTVMEIAADFLKNDLYIVPVVEEEKKAIGIVTRSEIKHALAKGMDLKK